MKSELVKPRIHEGGSQIVNFDLNPADFPLWAGAKRMESYVMGDLNHGFFNLEVDYTSKSRERLGSRVKHRIDRFMAFFSSRYSEPLIVSVVRSEHNTYDGYQTQEEVTNDELFGFFQVAESCEGVPAEMLKMLKAHLLETLAIEKALVDERTRILAQWLDGLVNVSEEE